MGMGVPILVVKREVLFKDGDFEGFMHIDEKDYSSIILENFEYQIRTKELENDSSWQQPIPYVWLVNPKTKKVFLYKRSTTGNEGRLFNKFSGGVGGHIDQETESVPDDPIFSAMMRELREETIIAEYPIPKIIGYIHFNSDVEAFHLGVVGIAETIHDVKPAEDMAHGQFYSIEEAEKIFSNPENNIERWTVTSWPFVKEYLNKLQ